ncbi:MULTISPECIES: hypothetical protein [unclassified Streptomyces]|uniref:hypothetical protein n=1 Tax=unclassified Streptomyces TaxID=2593676 RepID=UPI0019550A27|nr:MULTISPECIES: hypothetical protein [unclassified Streptomyces]
MGYGAWREGEDWAWIALAIGVAGSILIPVEAFELTRSRFPRITRGDRVKGEGVTYGDDTFVLWAPKAEQGPARAWLVRADVLEASLAR